MSDIFEWKYAIMKLIMEVYMEKIFIKESKKYENGAVFEFRYVGIPFENYSAEKAKK